MQPKARVNNVEDAQSGAATVGTSPSVDIQVNQIDNMLKQHKTYDPNYDSKYDETEDNCVAVIASD